MTKEDRIYGIFKGSSDDDEDDDRQRSRCVRLPGPLCHGDSSLPLNVSNAHVCTPCDRLQKEVNFVSGSGRKRKAAGDSSDDAMALTDDESTGASSDDDSDGGGGRGGLGSGRRRAGKARAAAAREGDESDESAGGGSAMEADDAEEVEEEEDDDDDDAIAFGEGLALKAPRKPPAAKAAPGTSPPPATALGGHCCGGLSSVSTVCSLLSKVVRHQSRPRRGRRRFAMRAPSRSGRSPRPRPSRCRRTLPSSRRPPRASACRCCSRWATSRCVPAGAGVGPPGLQPRYFGSRRAAARTPACAPQGMGLGPRGQGIAEPIEVKQRPKSMGLAFRDFDEKTTQAKKDEQRKAKEARGEAADDEESPVAAWRVDAQRTGKGRKGRRGRKTVYKTVEEILQENAEKDGAAPPPPGGGMKIVDMTGPEVRVVTTTDKKASQRVAYYSTSQHFPELRHNLRLIVDAAGRTRHAGEWRARPRG